MLAVSPCFLCGFRGKTDLHPLSAPLMTTKMVPLMVLPPAPPSVTASSSGHGTDTFPARPTDRLPLLLSVQAGNGEQVIDRVTTRDTALLDSSCN